MLGGLRVISRIAGKLSALRSSLLMIPGCRASPFSSSKVSCNAVLAKLCASKAHEHVNHCFCVKEPSWRWSTPYIVTRTTWFNITAI